MTRPTIVRLSLALALVLAAGALAATPALPAWAQTAEYDDTEAQLRIRQAATAAGAAARKVETLRQELQAERQRVVQTEGERELNQAALKTLEQELRAAEARQRELEAALAAAQDARTRGVTAEAERRRRDEGLRPQLPPSPSPSPSSSAASAPAPAPAGTTSSETLELAAWNTVAASTNPAMFEAFLSQFPRGVFAPMARVRLDELKAQTAGESQRRAEARRRAEEEARRKVEGEAEARRQAERDEAALRLGDRDRQRLQVALTALGFNTAGTDGVLGPRSREMIAGWQKARNQPPTGFVTAAQQQMLLQEAAAALSKHDEEQKRLDEERKKAAQAPPSAPPPASVAAPPAPAPPTAAETKSRTEQALDGLLSGGTAGSRSAAGYDGTYSGMVTYGNGTFQWLSIKIVKGAGAGTLNNPRCGKIAVTLKIDAAGSASLRIDGYDARCMSTLNSYTGTVVANQLKVRWSTSTAGGAELNLTRQ